MAWCVAMAAYFHEDDLLAFLVSMLVTFGSAFLFLLGGHKADNSLSRHDAFVVVTAVWVVFSIFGMIPFLVHGCISNPTDAYFETTSGFTTTGATILDDVECLPHGILFWRTFSQWIGGLGIVFFTIAVLPSMVGGSTKVFSAETTGPIKTKLHPRLSTSAKSIWVIFLCLTLVCAAAYKMLGMGWFDSLNYSMTTIATGGFSTHNDSIGFFHSPALEYVSSLFCFLSGLNFILMYRLFVKRDVKSLVRNTEVRFYLFLTLFFTLFIMLLLISRLGYDVEHAFRSAVYQVVSFITTTGLFNDDAARWPHVTWVVLAVCMFTGACAGSTSGGFKCIRCTMLLKIVSNEFKQILHPKAVLPLRFGDINVSMQRRITLLAYLTVYLLLCLVCAFTMIEAGIDNTNAITITVSTLSNVGPTLGTEIGPTMSWNDLPDFAKWMCSLLMLMGRLEIFSVLIIFTPTYWRDK